MLSKTALWTTLAILALACFTSAKETPVILRIADSIIAQPELKPLTRQALHPADLSGPLQFMGQEQLTKSLLEAYLDRAVVHMSGNSREPEVWGERGLEYLRATGAKFNHWADLGWVRVYTIYDWRVLRRAVDQVHGSDWGADVLFECGIMEAIGRQQVDSTEIPPWLLTLMEEFGIQDQRRFGPNGAGYFSYEGMFDRDAPNWPRHLVGLWYADREHEQSVPDITMLETQLYYAYLLAEYLDAGFEGVMFGQTMLTGARDKDNAALATLCEFARKWATARAYRKAVTLTSHIYDSRDWQGKPLFTHLTWPTRLSYSPEAPFELRMGPPFKAEGGRQGGEEIEHLLKLPHDLPILLEIDNYGRASGPSAVCEAGYDEITGFAAKPQAERERFLEEYYFKVRNWKNATGNNRVHLALPGYRCLCDSISLGQGPDGNPLPAVSFYSPFAEAAGEERLEALLFAKARPPESFPN